MASWRPVLIAEAVFLTEDLKQQTRNGIRQEQFRDRFVILRSDEGVFKRQILYTVVNITEYPHHASVQQTFDSPVVECAML